MRSEATHRVSFWGVRCYLNDDTGDLWGINRVHDALIPLAILFNNAMGFITELACPGMIEQGYLFRILEEYSVGNDKAEAGQKQIKEDQEMGDIDGAIKRDVRKAIIAIILSVAAASAATWWLMR